MRVYVHEFVVPGDAVDINGHANNVAYVGWMQDAAIAHSGHNGGTAAAHEAGGTWVVRVHRVEYLRPAFEGQRIEVRTWVQDLRRARSTRRYEFVRPDDGPGTASDADAGTSGGGGSRSVHGETVIARGETEWVFVDAKSGRPRMIPEIVRECFEVVGDASSGTVGANGGGAGSSARG